MPGRTNLPPLPPLPPMVPAPASLPCVRPPGQAANLQRQLAALREERTLLTTNLAACERELQDARARLHAHQVRLYMACDVMPLHAQRSGAPALLSCMHVHQATPAIHNERCRA